MKGRLPVVLLLLSIVVRGDTLPAVERFLSVPGAKPVTEKIRTFAEGELSPSLLAAIEHHLSPDPMPSRSGPIQGFTLDLNHDGRPEYFIYDEAASGSGGLSFLIFSRFGARWRLIEMYQGSLDVVQARTGWPVSVSIGWGGGGRYGKRRSEFSNGSYAPTLVQHCDDLGTVKTVYRQPPSRQDR